MHRRQFLFGSAALVLARHVDRCQAAARSIDLTDILEEARAKYDLPALAAAVVVGDAIYSDAVGVRKVGDPTPVTRDDQFHLGSCTKSMTSTLCGMLVEADKLHWESTLPEVFPDLAEKMDPAFRVVTVEHLLAHRSGLIGNFKPKIGTLREWLAEAMLGTPREQRRRIVELTLGEPPLYEPGKRFNYSNLGFMIAGAIIETVTDELWADVLRKRIFEPLGMKTAGQGPMGVPGKILQPWQHRETFGKIEPIEPFPAADNPPVMGPAGRVHCSVGDWSKYAREHLRGPRGESKLAEAATFQRLHTAPFGGTYGGGWGIADRDDRGVVLSHSGSNTMNFCTAVVNTKTDRAVMVMTNVFSDGAKEVGGKLGPALVERAVDRG